MRAEFGAVREGVLGALSHGCARPHAAIQRVGECAGGRVALDGSEDVQGQPPAGASVRRGGVLAACGGLTCGPAALPVEGEPRR
jgi:hypothetical protein